MTHGGILATILDEAMSWAITHSGDLGVTARMNIAFRRPAHLGEMLLVEARVTNRRGRVIDASSQLLSSLDRSLVAGAEGRFMRVTPEQAASWRAAYGVESSNSAFGRAAAKNSGSDGDVCGAW